MLNSEKILSTAKGPECNFVDLSRFAGLHYRPAIYWLLTWCCGLWLTSPSSESAGQLQTSTVSQHARYGPPPAEHIPAWSHVSHGSHVSHVSRVSRVHLGTGRRGRDTGSRWGARRRGWRCRSWSWRGRGSSSPQTPGGTPAAQLRIFSNC